MRASSPRMSAIASTAPTPLSPSQPFVETHRPDLIPHLSTCKSPQQMAGALIREVYPKHADLVGKRLVVVSVMPCTAKKYEAQDLNDVDYVLTTRELEHL